MIIKYIVLKIYQLPIGKISFKFSVKDTEGAIVKIIGIQNFKRQYLENKSL